VGCLGLAGRGLLILLIAYIVGLLFVLPVLTATRTTLLLAELVELPVRPLGLVTAAPLRISTTYGTPPDRLDVYLPASAVGDATLPAVVLGLGVHPAPLDSPEVVRIASAIARLGVVVGVPDSLALRQTRILAEEPTHLADAVLVVAGRPEVDPTRIGLAGFSAGASIALIAATDERIASDLQYVSDFGGYAHAEILLIDVASRTILLDGEVVPWAPDEGIRRDVHDLAAEALDDPALVDQLFGAPDRRTAEGLLADLDPATREDLAAISPLEHAGTLRAPVFILHGDSDTAIPISHALLLESVLGDRVARFTRFGQFGHGQPGQTGFALDDLPDLWALLLHLHDIVAATTEGGVGAAP
jgi:acetyl esterase/lipase